MCGRFALAERPDFEAEHWRLQQLPPNLFELFRPRYNIAPGQDVWAVRFGREGRSAVQLRWGFVPSWAKELKIGYKMINAQSETARYKPAFRAAWRSRRCLIPATGFYEWRRDGDRKRPQFIHLRSGEPFAFAGLWETWHGGGDPVHTCTILTTEANEYLAPIHPRMPVILPRDAYDDWLDPNAESDFLQSLMRPYPAHEMACYEVSTLVNSAANDSEACIRPVEA